MLITTEGLPTHCEFCGSELVWDSMNLICSNPDCKNVMDEKIKACVTNIAPIDGMGWKTFKKLLDEMGWNINSLDDLYSYARTKKCRWLDVKEGSEKDLFNKTLDKLTQPTSVSKFMLALNIPGVGKIGAEALEKYSGVEQLLNGICYCQTFKDDLDTYKSVYLVLSSILQDSTAAKSVIEFENFKHYLVMMNVNCKINNKITEEKGNVVITGSLSMKRSDFENLLKNNGWKLQNKINKDTKYLITNTPDSGTSKNKEADKLGVQKITESDFMNII